MDRGDRTAPRAARSVEAEPTERILRRPLQDLLALQGDSRTVEVLHNLVGLQAGEIHVLGADEVCAGRDVDCGLALGADRSVSRRHAVFTRDSAGITVTDLGSRNGTFVNGIRIVAPCLLQHGDTVVVGGQQLRFALEAEGQIERLRALQQAAVRDHLTGLFNRRFLEERLASEVAYALRQGSLLSVLVLDVDRFKQVNDTHGHLAGDVVLRAVAGVLAAGVRAEDVVARFGGEEFVVVARGSGSRGALALAERLRVCVASLIIHCEGQPVRVTVSAGAATLSPELPSSLAVMLAADAAMFRAKAQGRNRVVLAGREPFDDTGNPSTIQHGIFVPLPPGSGDTDKGRA